MEAGYLFSFSRPESLDLRHEFVRLRFFYICNLMFPGSLPHHDCLGVELRQSKELGGARFIVDVEPPLAPLLDGFAEGDVEVIDVGAHLDVEPSNWVGRPAVCLTLHGEQALPQALVRVDASEALAQRNEARDVQAGVRGQI